MKRIEDNFINKFLFHANHY